MSYMRIALISFTLLIILGCGKNEPLTFIGESIADGISGVGKVVEKVGRVPRLIGNKLLGTSDETDEDLEDLEDEVSKLKQSVDSQLTLIKQENEQVYLSFRSALNNLSNDLSVQKQELQRVEYALYDLMDNFITVIDPCGDHPTRQDEILLQLWDDTILSIYKRGKILTVLEDGNYITRDRTNCNFSIVNGQVID